MHGIPTGHAEGLGHVVELRGIAAGWVDDGPDPADSRSPGVQTEAGLAAAHPGGVSPERVDFAVVCQVSKRLGQDPVRNGIGAVSLMEHSESGLVSGVLQIAVEPAQLGRDHHSLVDNRAVGQGTDVAVGDSVPSDGPFDLATNQIQGSGEIGLRQIVRSSYEDLPDVGLLLGRGVPEHR